MFGCSDVYHWMGECSDVRLVGQETRKRVVEVRPINRVFRVVSTKRHRKTNQEHARSESSHGLAGKGIEKDEPEDAAIFAIGGLG